MGEIAEMVLEGILDCETGEYIGPACGYVRTASDAERDEFGLVIRKVQSRSHKRAAQRRRARARKRAAKRGGKNG